jgi:hypothetical protein
MSGQIQVIGNGKMVTSLPGLEAFKKVVSVERVSHAGKPNKSFHFLQTPSTERSTTVTRYQREYKVVFDFYKEDNEIVLSSIDGNPDIDDTYNEDFIGDIIDKARESLNVENNLSYNDEYVGE